MNQVPSVAPITTATATQNTIANLQAQMLRYTQAIESLSKQARADYSALQSAIATGDTSEAQAALSRLERDNFAASSTGATPASAASVHSWAPTAEARTPISLNKIA